MLGASRDGGAATGMSPLPVNALTFEWAHLNLAGSPYLFLCWPTLRKDWLWCGGRHGLIRKLLSAIVLTISRQLRPLDSLIRKRSVGLTLCVRNSSPVTLQ